jgi:glutamine synthetase
VGSSQSCAGANIVLNTIVADALDAICTPVEKAVADGKDLGEALQDVLSTVIKEHKRILFDGDNYSQDWHAEAERRGLPNLKDTPSALDAIMSEASVALFQKHGVLSERELHSRYEVYKENYEKTIAVEAGCALTMASTMIVPAAMAYQHELAATLKGVEEAGIKPGSSVRELLGEVSGLTEQLLTGMKALRAAVQAGEPAAMIAAMADVREAADALEDLLPEDLWPLPSYAEMMFM